MSYSITYCCITEIDIYIPHARTHAHTHAALAPHLIRILFLDAATFGLVRDHQ
jgi:hypothetical protein